jgi:hypothetical protein
MGLLQVDRKTVTAGPALTTWPPADSEILKAWLNTLLTVSRSEATTMWDEEHPGDVLMFLTERIHFNEGRFWPEKAIANTMERLTSFGAVKDNELTALGEWAKDYLKEKVTGPDEELTAAELIAYLADCDENEWDENFWIWLEAQPDQTEAARQLLTAAAPMEPRMRWIATALVEALQEKAVPVWREMVAVPGIGPHAKFALYTLEAGPEPDDDEWRWLAVESAAVALANKGPDEAVTVLWEALPEEEDRLATVRATDHPSASATAAAIADFVASAGAESLSVNQCLQLKVSLARWRPPIWRTVLMLATASLGELHRVVQILYDWDGDHMHAFRVGRAVYGDPMFPLEEAGDEGAMRVLAALNAGGGKITYDYDFGAGWVHEIVLQRKTRREPGASYPRCVKYSGDSPVEYPGDDDEPEPFDLVAVNHALEAI